jgi:hypothetical protein
MTWMKLMLKSLKMIVLIVLSSGNEFSFRWTYRIMMVLPVANLPWIKACFLSEHLCSILISPKPMIHILQVAIATFTLAHFRFQLVRSPSASCYLFWEMRNWAIWIWYHLNHLDTGLAKRLTHFHLSQLDFHHLCRISFLYMFL